MITLPLQSTRTALEITRHAVLRALHEQQLRVFPRRLCDILALPGQHLRIACPVNQQQRHIRFGDPVRDVSLCDGHAVCQAVGGIKQMPAQPGRIRLRKQLVRACLNADICAVRRHGSDALRQAPCCGQQQRDRALILPKAHDARIHVLQQNPLDPGQHVLRVPKA